MRLCRVLAVADRYEPVALALYLDVARPSSREPRLADRVVLEALAVPWRMVAIGGVDMFVAIATPERAPRLRELFVFDAMLEPALDPRTLVGPPPHEDDDDREDEVAAVHEQTIDARRAALARLPARDVMDGALPLAVRPLGSRFRCATCGAALTDGEVVEADPPARPAEFRHNRDYDRDGVWSLGAGTEWYVSPEAVHEGPPGAALIDLHDLTDDHGLGPSRGGCCGSYPAGTDPNLLCPAGHPVGFLWTECAFLSLAALLLDRVVHDAGALPRLGRIDGAWEPAALTDEPAERALRAAMRTDEAALLIYADWLAARGDLHGEYRALSAWLAGRDDEAVAARCRDVVWRLALY